MTVTYLSSRLMNLWDYFGRWLMELFWTWQKILEKTAKFAWMLPKMIKREKPGSAENGASKTIVQSIKPNSSGGAVVAASSSPMNNNSLNDPSWLAYFEKKPEKAGALIEAALAAGDAGALALIREYKDQYPRLNAFIDEVESKTVKQ